MTKRYWKVMLGESNKLIWQASQCFKDGYIGIDFLENDELTEAVIEKGVRDGKITQWGKISCNNLLSEMNTNDFVVCPDGYGNYAIGIIDDKYDFKSNRTPFPHIRKVIWQPTVNGKSKNGGRGIPRSKMSPELSRLLAARSVTIRNITQGQDSKLQKQLEELCSGNQATIKRIQLAEFNTTDVATKEKMLGDYFLKNWEDSKLGTDYQLFDNKQADDNGHEILRVSKESTTAAREYQTPVGNIDILAVKKKGKGKGKGREYLVIELKRTYSSDAVGQVIRYMGYLKSATNDGTKIRGCIIGHGEDDHTLSALEAINAFAGSGSIDIDFYCYEIEKLNKDENKITKLNLRKVKVPR